MTPQRTAIAGQTVVITIILAALMISAGILATSYLGTATTVTRTTTVTTTTTLMCDQQGGNSTSVSITNCQLGITLLFGVRNATIPASTNETFYVSLRNDLSSNNTVGLNGAPSLPHINESSPSSAVYILPPSICGGKVPAWIIVYNESGLPVQLNVATPFTGICGTSTIGIPYLFAPSQTLTQTISVGGYWHSSNSTEPWVGATYSQFSPGQYTVFAYDGWNQPITLNFTVE